MPRVISYKEVIEILSEVFIENNKDIFNFEITATNTITYHHIIKREELLLLDFPVNPSIKNGMVLSFLGHSYLNFIEYNAPDIYESINKIIILLSNEFRAPTKKERELLQVFLECFESRMEGYIPIFPKYLTRVR